LLSRFFYETGIKLKNNGLSIMVTCGSRVVQIMIMVWMLECLRSIGIMVERRLGLVFA